MLDTSTRASLRPVATEVDADSPFSRSATASAAVFLAVATVVTTTCTVPSAGLSTTRRTSRLSPSASLRSALLLLDSPETVTVVVTALSAAAVSTATVVPATAVTVTRASLRLVVAEVGSTSSVSRAAVDASAVRPAAATVVTTTCTVPSADLSTTRRTSRLMSPALPRITSTSFLS